MSSVENDGISASIVVEPLSPSPHHHGDVAVESAEKENPLADSPLSDKGGDDYPSQTPGSIEELCAKIVKQVEYYFSDENLPNDKFLLKHIQKDKAGFVSIAVIASFRKVKKLTKDIALIVDALKESSFLVVSPDGKKVRRLHPLPLSEFKDPNPKLHALVEYETVEIAEKAAVTLNDEKDWRNGLRVHLLHKRMPYGLRRKAWRGSDADKGSHTRQSAFVADENSHGTSECHDDTKTHPEPQDGDGDGDGGNIAKEKDGQRGRNRRSKGGYKHRVNISMGHGNGSMTACAAHSAAKPPPGPRMPDGTKGFAMGRGRHPVTTQV